MSDLGIFGQVFRKKNYCQIWKQHPKICLLVKFNEKQKCLNLEPKMPDFGLSGMEFEKDFIIFEISTLKFVQWQNFSKNKNA